MARFLKWLPKKENSNLTTKEVDAHIKEIYQTLKPELKAFYDMRVLGALPTDIEAAFGIKRTSVGNIDMKIELFFTRAMEAKGFKGEFYFKSEQK